MNYLDLSFRDFLDHKVKEHGDRTFLVDKGRSYSWSDIDKGAQLVASDLTKIGVSKRSRVALCCTNGIGFVTAFFAIQKLGAMALLINHTMLSEEVGTTAAVGDATHFVYGNISGVKEDPNFIEKTLESAHLSADKAYDLCEDTLSERIDSFVSSPALPDVRVESDDVSLMIFTSGSTGKPKGVMHSAYNILNASMINSKDQTLTADDRSCLILPLFHVFGLVAGLFANAIADSTIYIPKDRRTSTILDTIEQNRCTVFHSVPTLLIALINNRDFDMEKVRTLRCTIISGAGATEAQIEQFKKVMPHNRFLASYGLSEVAPASITLYIDSEDHVLHTVGRIVEGVEIRIIDPETKKDCPNGVSGEIIVKSPRLMAGYYRIPADDQALDEDGWIHTGDLGFIREDDGYLVLCGRIKDLIIRGGENIMPSQVENAISSFDFIDNVRVLGIPSDFFGEEVAACIILKDGTTYDEKALRSALSQKLAKFKMPTYIEVYDSFPMLGSGKIDSIKLKEDLIRRISLNK